MDRDGESGYAAAGSVGGLPAQGSRDYIWAMANSGDAFEERVYKYISAQLKKGALGIDPKLAVVHHKREYWSKSREDNIITDVSVEVSRSGAATPFFIWVIECKDLGKNVPVDDIEEFHNKLQQIGAHKGSMAARSGFATGALAYAKSHKIGLMRVKSPGQVTMLLEHTAPVDVEIALTEEIGSTP